MKKIFALLSLCLFGTTAFAQDNYAFSDKDGNVFEDGITIECSETEDDGFGGILVPSNLYVKNVGAPDDYQVSIQANITKMDNGSLQLCFPTNCISYTRTGKQSETAKSSVSSGKTMNLMTEWLPNEYGECTVTYTAMVYQSIFSKSSRTITINYKYADPAGINQVKGGKGQSQAFYDLLGRRSTTATKGFNIVRMSDGSIRKTIVK